MHRRRLSSVLALAAPLALMLACDEPPGPPDAAPRPVTVHAFAPDNPVAGRAGVMILFSNPDGSIAAVARTDERGEASAILPEGGAVSSVWTEGGPIVGNTVAGVEPGDVVDVTMFGLVDACQASSARTVTLQAFAGAARYEIVDGVSAVDLGGALTGALPFMSCAGRSLDVLAIAFDAAGRPIATALRHVSPQAGDAPVAMPAFSAVGAFHVHAAGADVAGATISIARSTRGYRAAAPAITGVAAADLDLPDVAAPGGSTMWIEVTAAGGGGARLIDPLGDDRHAYDVDVATEVPSQTLHADYADRRLDVTTSQPFDADFLYAHFTGVAAAGPMEWYVVAPPTATSVVMPQLPAELAAYDLLGATRPTVALVQNAHVTSWATWRTGLLPSLTEILGGDRPGSSRTVMIYTPG